MKIASIDIGTNAIKSKVFNTTPTSIDFIEGIISPIRLGAEVFNSGELFFIQERMGKDCKAFLAIKFRSM